MNGGGMVSKWPVLVFSATDAEGEGEGEGSVAETWGGVDALESAEK